MFYLDYSYKNDFLDENQIMNFLSIYNDSNELLRKISLKRDVRLIDLDLLVPKKDSLFVDSIHLNNNGSILVSNIITNKIENLIEWMNFFNFYGLKRNFG